MLFGLMVLCALCFCSTLFVEFNFLSKCIKLTTLVKLQDYTVCRPMTLYKISIFMMIAIKKTLIPQKGVGEYTCSSSSPNI